MQKLIITPVVTMWLSACVTLGSGSPQDTTGACPSLVDYTDAQREAAAEHIDTLPYDHIITLMVDDYGRLRAGVRAMCR